MKKDIEVPNVVQLMNSLVTHRKFMVFWGITIHLLLVGMVYCLDTSIGSLESKLYMYVVVVRPAWFLCFFLGFYRFLVVVIYGIVVVRVLDDRLNKGNYDDWEHRKKLKDTVSSLREERITEGQTVFIYLYVLFISHEVVARVIIDSVSKLMEG